MDPLTTGALISGGANLLGGLFSQSSARNAYQHRYQDSVADLEKAGLNPALAYGQSPGGGAQTHDFGNVGSGALAAGAAAASAKQAEANRRLTNAQAELLEQQTTNLALRPGLENARIASETNVANRTAELRGHERDRAKADATVAIETAQTRIERAKIETELERLGIPEAKAWANFYSSWVGRNQGGIQTFLDLVRAATGVTNAFSARSAAKNFSRKRYYR